VAYCGQGCGHALAGWAESAAWGQGGGQDAGRPSAVAYWGQGCGHALPVWASVVAPGLQEGGHAWPVWASVGAPALHGGGHDPSGRGAPEQVGGHEGRFGAAVAPVVGAAGWAQGGGHARVDVAEPDEEQGGGHFAAAPAEPGCGHGGGQGLEVGQQAAGSQGGRQGRAGSAVLGQDGVATTEAAIAARSAAEVVVVDPSATGGDSDGDAASALDRAASAPGATGDGPPDIVATERAVCDPGSACDTATSARTMAMLLSATSRARGDTRRIQRRCTDPTSYASRLEARAPARARPQPVRLSSEPLHPVGGDLHDRSTGRSQEFLLEVQLSCRGRQLGSAWGRAVRGPLRRAGNSLWIKDSSLDTRTGVR
jgi:hypothetical protein